MFKHIRLKNMQNNGFDQYFYNWLFDQQLKNLWDY